MKKIIFQVLIGSIYFLSASAQEVFETLSDKNSDSFLEGQVSTKRFGSKETILIHNQE